MQDYSRDIFIRSYHNPLLHDIRVMEVKGETHHHHLATILRFFFFLVFLRVKT